MCELLLIADDLTGTLDCSVAFGSGVEVWTCVPSAVGPQCFADAAPVVAVNANTRHLSPADAAHVVDELTRAALEAGVANIYKKCDSALRGNVGAELGALHAAAAGQVWFAPAFPKNGRVTRAGVQYVDGVPVAESALGRDPFEPVRNSAVAAIIAEQSVMNAQVVAPGACPASQDAGVFVFDAATDDDLLAIAKSALAQPAPRLLAGCAGFSTALAELGIVTRAEKDAPTADTQNLLVFCGSVNPVSQGQCAYATAAGVPTVTYNDAEKRSATYLDSEAGRAMVAEAAASWDANPLTIVDASDLGTAPAGTVVSEDVRSAICANLGRAAARIAEAHGSGNLMVMGGDVLAAFLGELGVTAVRMLGEVVPGVVMFTFAKGANTWRVVSKSGSFGGESLFVDLASHMQ